MNKTTKGFLIILSGLISTWSFQARADILYLKNGERLEGIIRSQGEENITLDVGSGVITIMREALERIETSDQDERDRLTDSWIKKYYKKEEYLPAVFRDVVNRLDRIERQRRQALESLRESSNLAAVIDAERHTAEALARERSDIALTLAEMNAESDPRSYNELVALLNRLQALLDSRQEKITILLAEKKKNDALVHAYVDAQARFRHDFDTVLWPEKKFDDKEKLFLATLQKRIKDLAKDFTSHSAAYDDFAGGILVEALLNDTRKATFLVDTGASLVLLPAQIARELDLKPVRTSAPMTVTVADGRTVNAGLVIVKSIKVGDVVCRNVEAAILETETADQPVGLLGMSFLKNFLVKIDSRNKKIFFDVFSPEETSSSN